MVGGFNSRQDGKVEGGRERGERIGTKAERNERGEEYR
jgi:hypothetical protein